MNNLTKISIISTPEAAVKKLKKSSVSLYSCKTDGAKFIFGVKDEDVKKVFAIFSKPCYNVRIEYKSRRVRFTTKLINRIGLIVGAVLFACIAAYSNLLVLKISVTGSGSYLSPEVRRIVYDMGMKEFSFCRNFDYPAATGKILSLPQVTFCNIQKRGAILQIDVEVDEEHFGSTLNGSLKSDVSGTVLKIVAICGTAEAEKGGAVKEGDTLIGAYSLDEEGNKTPCLAVGFAEIECKGRGEYIAKEESDENLKAALSSINLLADNILSRAHTVETCEEGVKYIIDFTYLRKLSINLT